MLRSCLRLGRAAWKQEANRISLCILDAPTSTWIERYKSWGFTTCFLQDHSPLSTRKAASLACVNQRLSITATVSNQRVIYGKQGQREEVALAALRLYTQSFIPSVLYFYVKASWDITIFFIIICGTKYWSTQCQMANIQNKNNARPIMYSSHFPNAHS